MCLLEPFITQCCGRTYVKASKVPSCPDAWPKAKCPPELCIQLGGPYRSDATCWRCQADLAGLHGWKREQMRPGIDKAYVVPGLDEIGVAGRRQRVEEGGHCWFCNARGGCETCGADETLPWERLQASTMVTQTMAGLAKGKGKRKLVGFGDEVGNGKGKGKKTRAEQQRPQKHQQPSFISRYTPGSSHQQATNTPSYSSGLPTLMYPTTAIPSSWQRDSNPFDTANSTNPFALDGLPQRNEYSGESSGSAPGHYSSSYDRSSGGQPYIDPALLPSSQPIQTQGEREAIQDGPSSFPTANLDTALQSYGYKLPMTTDIQGETQGSDQSAPQTLDPQMFQNNWESDLFVDGHDDGLEHIIHVDQLDEEPNVFVYNDSWEDLNGKVKFDLAPATEQAPQSKNLTQH